MKTDGKADNYSLKEISTMYRDAKDKLGQIKILSELNDCTPAEIIRKLKMCGYKIDEPKKKAKYPKDLTGMKFGKWEVVEELPSNNRNSKWLCRCECGREKSLKRFTLISGNGQGCLCDKEEK